MQRRIIFAVLLLFHSTIGTLLFSQSSSSSSSATVPSLQGTVVDASTLQPLSGVTVRVVGTTHGAISNKNGVYSIRSIEPGQYRLQFSSVGYTPASRSDVVIRSGRCTFLDVSLQQSSAQSADVTVQADYFATSDATNTSAVQFSAEEIRRAPGSAGDVNRVLSSSASVGRVDDSRADLTVRGGSPAENVFSIDNMPIININYFPKQGATGGPISFLNISQVRNLNFSAGSFDASHNGLSAGIDVSLRDPNTEQFAAQVDLNMIGVGASVEGPFGGGSSYYASVSRGYLDLLKGLLDQTGTPQWANGQSKLNLKLGPDDKINVLFFSALSDFTRDKTEGLETNTSANHNQQWQNMAGANWQHLFGSVGYTNTSLSYNSIHSFEYSHVPQNDSLFFDNETSLRAMHIRNQTHLLIVSSLEADLGADARIESHDLRAFIPASIANSTLLPAETQHHLVDAFHADAYFSLLYRMNSSCNLSTGLRVERSSYGSYGSLQTTLLPRVSLQYKFSEQLSASVFGGISSQVIPMGLLQYSLQNSFPDSPMFARHMAASISWLAREDMRIQLEAYDKRYSHMPIDVNAPEHSPLDAAIGDFDFDQTRMFRFDGKAHSYGVELSLQKKMTSRIYTMIGASYSRSLFTDGNGVERSRVFDNRFLFNATAGWNIDDSWELSGQASVVGGNAYTPLDAAASAVKGEAVQSGPTMSAHLPVYRIINLRVDKRFHFAQSNIIVYLTALNAFDIQNIKNIEWNPYSKTVTETHHIGMLPILGVEWQL